MCVLLPPGAAHRSSTRSPGWGSSSVSDEHRRARLREERALRPQGRVVDVERLLQHERLGHVRVRVRAHWESFCKLRPASVTSSVRPQRHLARLVVGGHQRARVVRTKLLPPQACDPRRVGVLDRGLLGCGVAERSEQRGRALAPCASQRRVDEPVTGARVRLGKLDGVGDDGVVGRAVQVQQLIQTEPQRRRSGGSRLLTGRSASASIR